MDLVTATTVLIGADASPFPGQQPYDLVGIAAIKAELDIDEAKYDSLFKTWVTQASAAAAKFTNRVFPVETVADRIWPPRDYFPAPTVIGGVKPLQLSRWPIVNIPSTAGTAPPNAPALSAVAGGSLAAATYYVKTTYLTPTGETAASAESVLAVAADNLLQVAGPPADQKSLATGWNCYVGTSSYGETLQNSSPLPIGAPFTLPASGLVTTGAALPDYLLVYDNQRTLAEGIDFIVKPEEGQLVRLDSNGWAKRWPALITNVVYSAGYTFTDPRFADAQEAVTKMVKDRWFARTRDSRLRSENMPGAYEAQYWFASGPGAAVGNLTPDVEALLEKYRVPVTG